MKKTKIIALLLCFILIVSVFAGISASANSIGTNDSENLVYVGVVGDTDNDHLVSVMDSTNIQLASAQMVDFNTNTKKLADVTGDNSCDVIDSTAIQMHQAGLKANEDISTALFVEKADFVNTFTLDIEPKFSIEYDDFGKVVDVFGDNALAKQLLEKLGSIKDLDCKEVVSKLVTLCYEQGYFQGFDDSTIKTVIIKLLTGSVLPNDSFVEDLDKEADDTADDLNVHPDFIIIDDDDFDDKYDFENIPSHFITIAKAQEIALKYAGVRVEDAVFTDREFELDDNKPYYELEFVANGFEFECDINAITGKVTDFEKERLADGGGFNPQGKFITLDDAKKIALEHAGVKEADARFSDREFDVDDGTPYYELEFVANGVEYEYDIHAVSGDILEVECDIDDDDFVTDSTDYIDASSAKTIAFAFAKADDSTAKELEIEFDIDDSVPYYEIEFIANGFEYEFDIHAVKGVVLDFEIERVDDDDDDDDDNVVIDPSTLIGIEKAKQIALEHAGVKEADATFFDKEFDLDDGTPYYEIEFVANGFEYEYDIHAVSGQIIEFEKEPIFC